MKIRKQYVRLLPGRRICCCWIRYPEKNAPLNPAASAEGGAGLKAAQFLIDNGVEALITPRCGINSAEVLKEAGISIYKCQGEDAEENSAFFQEGKLSLMEKFHGGFHGKR